MDLLQQFSQFLRDQKNPPSDITIRNYIADIRSFIRWHDAKFGKRFNPVDINSKIIYTYKQSNIVSARSIERHLSSLRKFYFFLESFNPTIKNPFSETVENKIEDPWKIQEFKNKLYRDKAAYLTIKNYINDLLSFQKWIKEALPDSYNIQKSISESSVAEYKNRLIEILRLSPNTVNRKLSSIRKYIDFAQTQGIIDSPIENPPQNVAAKQNQTSEAQFDISQIINAAPSESYVLKRIVTKAITPYLFMEEKISFLITSAILKIRNVKTATDSVSEIKNIKKEFYAPLEISIQHFPWHKKTIFHIRYTRPKWYKTYHSYSISHYLHLGILLAYCVFTALSLYYNVIQAPEAKPVLAAGIDPPLTYMFRGKLLSQNNQVVSEKSIRFALYSSPTASGAAMLWQEVENNIQTDQNGNFSTLLGTATPIPASLIRKANNLYVGITIENTEELLPRQRLNAAAYAMDSNLLNGLPLITQSGAGNSNVVLALDSAGKLTIGGNSNPVFQSIGGSFSILGTSLILGTNIGSNGNVVLSPDGNGKIDLQSPIINSGMNTNILSPDGNRPTAGAVEIDDSLAILSNTNTQPAVTISQNGFGDLLTASQSGTPKFTVDYTGSITNGSWQSNTISSQYGGTGANLASASAGTIPYFSSAGVMGFVSSGIPGTVLVSNGMGTAPSWTSFDNTTKYWNSSANLLFPTLNTLDFALGGNSTNSAKFAVTGINGANPSLFLKNNINNTGLILGSNGSIQSTYNKQLIIGGNTTGDIVFSPGNTQALILSATGKTGIGTFSPEFRLDVKDSQSSTVISQIYNTDTGPDADGITIKLGSNTSSVANTNRFVSFETAGLGIVGSIEGNGGKNIAYKTNGPADFAEYLKKNPNEYIPYGSLLCIDDNGFVSSCIQSITTSLIGVASANPTFVGGKNLGDASIGVGIVGQIKVRVSTINGAIKPGDAIGPTSTPGIGAKSVAAQVVVGRALEAYSENGIGEISVAVQPSWYEPSLYIGNLGIAAIIGQEPLDIVPTDPSGPSFLKPLYTVVDTAGRAIQTTGVFSQAVIGSLSVGFVRAKTIAADNLLVNGNTIQEYIKKIITDSNRGNAAASPMGEIAKINTNIISPLGGTDITFQLGDATGSGRLVVKNADKEVASIDSQGNINSQSITVNTASISGSLSGNTISANMVSGQDASFSGTLTADVITASTISGLDTKVSSLAAQYIKKSQQEISFMYDATTSSRLLSQTLPSSFADIASVSADFVLARQGIVALGPASFASASVADQLSIGANFILSNNSINTLGSDLEINPLGQGGISFLAGKIKIATDGTLFVGENANFAKDVTIKGTLTTSALSPLASQDISVLLGDSANASQSFAIKNPQGQNVARITQAGDFIASGSANLAGDIIASGSASVKKLNIFSSPVYAMSDTEVAATGSAGIASIKKYKTEVTVDNPLVTENSLIYITPVGDTGGQVVSLSRQTPTNLQSGLSGSFTVGISKILPRDIQFNWIIVN